MLFLTGDRYLLGAGLFLVANIAFGASIVVYYSFLPQTRRARTNATTSPASAGRSATSAAALLLLLNVVAVLFKDSLGMTTGEVARWSIVSAGVWWAGFTTIPLLGLRNRPPLDGPTVGGNVLTDGFSQLWRTLRSLRAYPLTLFFLVAYLIYNDGIQTVIAHVGRVRHRRAGPRPTTCWCRRS